MKEKILSSRFVRWISNLKISRDLSGHPALGKIFNYETITYLIAGVLTTAVNYGVYFLIPRFEPEMVSVVVRNTAAWLVAVIFAFFVNKIFVFDSLSWDAKTVGREFFSFIVARLLSWGFESLFLFITVGVLHWNEPVCKLIATVFVLVMNYFASKFLIFVKKKPAKEEEGKEETYI